MNSRSSMWDWCIYEAGLFMGSRPEQSTRRIIILFDQNKHTLPDPLKHLQAIPAEQVQVEEFLRQFYGTSDLTGVDPINSPFAKNASMVARRAAEICHLLTTEISAIEERI